MPPIDFEQLAKNAFDEVKSALGIEVLYMPRAGGQFILNGVFDDRAQEVDADTEISVSSNVYTLGIKDTDLPFSPAKGDKVVIKSLEYRVLDAMEDGVPGASTVLVLHRTKGAQ